MGRAGHNKQNRTTRKACGPHPKKATIRFADLTFMFAFADRSIVADKERRREIKIVLKKAESQHTCK